MVLIRATFSSIVDRAHQRRLAKAAGAADSRCQQPASSKFLQLAGSTFSFPRPQGGWGDPLRETSLFTNTAVRLAVADRSARHQLPAPETWALA